MFAHSRPLRLGWTDSEAFASLYKKILIGLSAKETALMLYPADAAYFVSSTRSLS
jgi:hypothetical protein